MGPRLHIITLGVADLPRALRFYRDALGWPLSSASAGDLALFRLHTSTALALYPRRLLAVDANLADPGGFGGITLAHNAASRDQVNAILAQAVETGDRLLKEAVEAEWGGYSGYFADPDGHPWEVAWNPHFPLHRGLLVLPDDPPGDRPNHEPGQ